MFALFTHADWYYLGEPAPQKEKKKRKKAKDEIDDIFGF